MRSIRLGRRVTMAATVALYSVIAFTQDLPTPPDAPTEPEPSDSASSSPPASAPSQPAIDLDQIVVTATRREAATFDSPAAVSIVSAADIEKKGTVRVLDALKDLPGVYVRDYQGVPSTFAGQVLIRGVAGYARNAVLLNGQPINDSFSGGVNWSLVDTDSVQRVEVVRGPFSSLYGGAAMGGVVNIITKSPIDDELTVKGGYGSDALSSGYAALAHRFGDELGVRLEAGTTSSSGYLQDFVSKTPSAGSGTVVTGAQETETPMGADTYIVGDKGPRGWWQNNAGATLRWNPFEQAHLDLGVRYHEDEAKSGDPHTDLVDAQTGDPVSSGNPAVNDTQHVSVKPSDYLSGPNGEDIWRYTVAYEQAIGTAATVKFDAYYSDIDYWYLTPTAGVATPDGGTGKYDDIPNSRSGFNASIGSPLGDRQYWTSGLAFTGDDLHKRELTIADWRGRDSDPTSGDTYRADGQSQTYAAYVQDEITAGERLKLYAGARYDYWTTKGAVDQYTAPAFSTEYPRRHQDSASPKLSGVYTPFDDTVIRASVGTAFRSPTLSDLYSTFTSSNGSTTYASSDLKPETITAFEIGTEQRLGGGRLSATVFYNQLKNMIASMSTPNPDQPSINDSVRINVGRATIKGFEVGLRQPVLAGVEAFANYTCTDTDVTENAADLASVGKHLTLIPKQTFNFGAQAQQGNGFGYIAGRYIGKVFGDSHNLDTVNGVYGSYDPFLVLDAKAGYKIADRYTVSLAGSNLLDRHYYQSSLSSGRSFLAELSWRVW